MIDKIGVIGAGQMGSGIAQVFAQHEFEVKLADISQKQLDKALVEIKKNLDRLVAKGALKESDVTATMRRIDTTDDFTTLGDCGLVIEAATENEAVRATSCAPWCRICAKTPSSPPTPPRFRSRASPRSPTVRASSSACIS